MSSRTLSCTGSGSRDWLLQRISAVILAFYFVTVLLFWLLHPQLTFSLWQSFFSPIGMRVFTTVALGAFFFHVWIGLWVVSTDYIKPLAWRLLFQVVMILTLLVEWVWGAAILWRL